jgi:hypothetical protein
MKANETIQLPPIIKQVEVACTPARAFALFTAEIHAWWPLASHSMFEGEAECVSIEPRVGGRVFERARDGREYDWGTVLAWSAPEFVRFTWRVGKAANSQQEVEVRFEPCAKGTRVVLTHSGFELAEQRKNYDSGWGFVLGTFVAGAAR